MRISFALFTPPPCLVCPSVAVDCQSSLSIAICRPSMQVAAGRFDVQHYAWVHLVLGQREATAEAMKPTYGGFQKRFSLIFPPAAAEQDNELPCTGAMALCTRMSRLMARQGKQKQIMVLDRKARTLFKAVVMGAQDFIRDHDQLDPFLLQKVKLHDTDVLRYTNVVRRMLQTLQGQSDEARAEASLVEVVYALHQWHRQLQYHAAFYRWAKDKWPQAGLQAPAQPAQAEKQLSHKLWAQKEWLTSPRFRGEVTWNKARDIVRHKLAYRNCSDVRRALQEAISDMIDKGLLNKSTENVAEQPESRKRKTIEKYSRVPFSILRRYPDKIEYCNDVLSINVEEQE